MLNCLGSSWGTPSTITATGASAFAAWAMPRRTMTLLLYTSVFSIVRFGTGRAISLVMLIWRATSVLPVRTSTWIGTFWSFSERFCATTTISFWLAWRSTALWFGAGAGAA